MFLRRLGFITFVLVLIMFVLRQPTGAAHGVKSILAGLATLADALGRFVSAF
ncbi:hypothetical protein ACFVH6_21595 [Spirillospora sp. NPDC127200]